MLSSIPARIAPFIINCRCVDKELPYFPSRQEQKYCYLIQNSAQKIASTKCPSVPQVVDTSQPYWKGEPLKHHDGVFDAVVAR